MLMGIYILLNWPLSWHTLMNQLTNSEITFKLLYRIDKH